MYNSYYNYLFTTLKINNYVKSLQDNLNSIIAYTYLQ